MNDNLKGRVLVHAGKWLVPEPERPANWRSILDEAIGPTLNELVAATDEKQTREQVVANYFDWYRREVKADTEESASAFGADGAILIAGHMLIIGMFCREPERISVEMDYQLDYVRMIAERYTKSNIWREDMTVWLGEEDENAGIRYWLLAMAGSGHIDVTGWNYDGPFFKSTKVAA